jgi:MFS family permease
MLADMIIIAAGAAISALANGFPMLFVGQLLVGVGIGINFPTSGSYVSEVLPKRIRARMMVATIACQSVGMLLAAMITLLLLKNVHSAQIWRLFLATEGVIALLFFLLRLSEPDSPHWLMVRGRFAEAAQSFIQIMPEQREAVLQITSNAANPSVANSVEPAKPGVAILFSRAYRARTVLVAVPWFLMDIATYGVGLFTPIILGAIDVSVKRVGVIAHDFADARGSAGDRFVPAVRFSSWNLGGPTLRAHSHVGYRFREHRFRHVAAHVRRPPIEFSRRRGTHSTRVRRVRFVQLVNERWT